MKWYCPFFAFFLMGFQLVPEQALVFGSTRAISHLFLGTVTAYTSSPRDITASGAPASDGVIACPRKYPLGTIFKIQGRMYKCGDRLSRKYDNRLDIWKPTEIAARLFGKQKLLVVAVIPPERTGLIGQRFNGRLRRY
jgi:3D (Asp-Asp-Asp) domain-containing protein